MSTAVYLEQPYKQTLTARIVKTLHLPTFQPPRTGIILDKTIFYPEGGGQPGDRGMLGDHPILDTKKAGELGIPAEESAADEIIHIIALNGLTRGGSEVELRLDWARRFDFMQQHSGQHLLSAAFWHIGKYPTVSVHQGEEYTTIEFEAGDIPDRDIIRACELANAAILADLPIVSRTVSREQLEELSLRRDVKVSDNIRILEIGAAGDTGNASAADSKAILHGLHYDGFSLPLPFDRVGCGGVHCRRTGEIRLIQHVKTERIRGRVRLYWKIGNRALVDYDLKHRISDNLVTLLSRSVPDLPDRVAQMSEEIASLRKQVRDLQRSAVYQRLDEAFARDNKALYLQDADMNLLRDSVKRLQKQGVTQGLLCATHRDEPGKIFWCLLWDDEPPLDFPKLKKEILDPQDARGGGKAPLWQGSITLADDSGRHPTHDLLEERAKAFLSQLQAAVIR